MHSFLPTFLGGTFFSLLDVSKRNIFSGGRVVCARARSAPPPPAYAPGSNVNNSGNPPSANKRALSV